ncbi:MAG: metal-dependent hydrolase [Myxococcales bacterium]|nr:MAG: metal-dependent hydrolase [Myxococcales bacterium]
MFIGHYAVAFGAKRFSPRVSLGTAFIACQLLDLIWPLFVVLGMEQVEVDPSIKGLSPLRFSHYPWSHSLMFTLLWSALFASLLYLAKKQWRVALVMAAVVSSHWLLDLLTHRPDLPLWPSGPKWGLGLWNSPIRATLIELGMFIAAVLLYVDVMLKELTKGRRWGLFALIAFLLVVYGLNLFGPKPSAGLSPQAIATPAFALWLLVPWAYWIESKPRVVHSDRV